MKKYLFIIIIFILIFVLNINYLNNYRYSNKENLEDRIIKIYLTSEIASLPNQFLGYAFIIQHNTILSSWHLFQDHNLEKISFYHNDEIINVKLKNTRANQDLVFFTINKPQNKFKTLKTTNLITHNEKIQIPFLGNFLIQNTMTTLENLPGLFFTFNKKDLSLGSSGLPIFNTKQELIGVIVGKKNNSSVGSYIQELN